MPILVLVSGGVDCMYVDIKLKNTGESLGEICIRSKKIEEVFQRVAEDLDHLTEYLTWTFSLLEDGRELVAFKVTEDSECELSFIAGDAWSTIMEDYPYTLLAYPSSGEEVVLQLFLKGTVASPSLESLQTIESDYS